MVRVSRTRSRISSARMALPPRRGSGRRAYSDRPLPARPGPRRLNESSFSGEGRAMRAMGGEERGDRRRTQILDAAARVFAERGYHRTTVRDIAREAGIADGTIYLYFSSKQELLLGLIAQLGRFAERRADFAEAGAMDLRDFSRSYQALVRRTAEGEGMTTTTTTMLTTAAPPIPDIASAAFKSDPVPACARLRTEQAVVRMAVPFAEGHAFVVTRYAEAAAVLRDER